MIAIYVILILMIIGAIVAIEVKDLLSAVVALGAVGLGLSLVCLILKAPDVALTQLVVEIITVIILIRATIRKGLPESTHHHSLMSGIGGIVFVVCLLGVAWFCFRELPSFGEPYMHLASVYLHEGVADTGATNIVMSVLLDYRAYDTLGEATVLFAAVMGVLAVVRSVGRKEEGSAESDNE